MLDTIYSYWAAVEPVIVSEWTHFAEIAAGQLVWTALLIASALLVAMVARSAMLGLGQLLLGGEMLMALSQATGVERGISLAGVWVVGTLCLLLSALALRRRLTRAGHACSAAVADRMALEEKLANERRWRQATEEFEAQQTAVN